MGLFGLFKSKNENFKREQYRRSRCYFCNRTITVSKEKFYACSTHSRSKLEEKYHYIVGNDTGHMTYLCVCESCAQHKLKGDEFSKECPVCVKEGITGMNAFMSIGPYY